jgi:hypothetical protein
LLPEGGSVGSPDSCFVQDIEAPLRSFAAGAGAEIWIMHDVIPNPRVFGYVGSPTITNFISIKINIQDLLLSMTLSGFLGRIL